MSQKKNTHSKVPKVRPVQKNISQEIEEPLDPLIPKNKKTVDIELPDEPISVLEEKVDEESSPTEDSEDVNVDEISLDDDELNPFGDKWEQ